MCVRACVCARMHAFVCVHVRACIFVMCVCVCVYVCVCVCVCVYDVFMICMYMFV